MWRTIILMLLLAGCTPPSAPSVMALPPAGKSLTTFQNDNTVCRGYAAQTMEQAAQSTLGDAQTRYDSAYSQCMYSRGDTVAPRYTYLPYAYGGNYARGFIGW